MLFQIHDRQLAGELATAESVTAKDPNYVDTFGLDFAFSFANILLLIAFIISYCLFADELNIQQSLLDRAIVVLIIILLVYVIIRNLSCEARRQRSTLSTLLARFIPTTKIRNLLLKKNAAKSRILLACADRRTRQCYLTICAILKHYNFNIHVSLATDTLHLLLKGLVMKMLDFMQDILDDIYSRALERINVFKEEFRVYRRTLEEEKNFNYPKALDSIYTRANSEAYYITIVKQFYSMTNKKEYILQICLYNSQRTALLAADYATIVKQRIQPHLTKLPLSEVAANIAISNFIYAAAQFSSKRHNDSKHCDEELYLILTIINYTRYNKDGKHIAYIRAFSKVLLFNNNRQIDNTTRMLSFYDLSTIIRLVHLVPRDLPNLTTRTTMSYYVNNYIN
ncbi:hypothetical protein HBI71_149210 [Parastagonospora nodorum]|nr:hypothetical protein HBI71_149210 [Parastagonospora nodorum]